MSNSRKHIRAMAIAVVYYGVMQASLLAIVQPENVSVLWLPSGFLVALLLLTPRTSWLRTLGWVGAVHLAAAITSGRSAGLIAGYMLANGAEVFIATLVYQWAAGQWATGRPIRLESIRSVVALPLLGLGSVVSATIAAGVSVWVGGAASYGDVWRAWVMASFDSMLVLTPALLVLRYRIPGGPWTLRSWLEAALLMVLLVTAVALVFGGGGDAFLYLYLPYPIIIWAAIRFRTHGAVVASVVLAVIAIAFTVLERGSMAQMLGHPSRLLWLQAYLGGAMLTGLVVATAILERERAEFRVRQSERLYQTLADAAPVGIFRTTADGAYRYANAAWTAMTEPQPEESVASNWLQDIAVADRERVDGLRDLARGAGQSVGARFRLAPVGELSRLVYGKIAAEIDDAGQLIGYVGSVTDLSALAESERERHLLAAAIAQSTDGIAVFTSDWHVVYLNTTYERLTGATAAGALQQDLRSLAGSEGIPWTAIEAVMRTGEAWSGTVAVVTALGTRKHEDISVAAIRESGEGAAHYLMLRRDVTEEFRLASQLQQAQKMEAVGVLAGGIAHDFNNLLTAIIGSVQISQHRARKAGIASSESLDVALAAAVQAGALTRNLLTLSRRAELRTGPCDINAIVGDAVRMLRRSGADTGSVIVRGSEGLPTISGDAGQLTQALLNLMLNGRDAMAGDGTLEISTRLRTPGADELDLHPHAPRGEYVEISVADEGSGMRPDVVSKIFDPFFTTKKQGDGTGLGLAMVYACAQAHRGWIAVSSELGRGTRFDLVIPAVHETTDSFPRLHPVPGTGTVLLVDDTAMVLETARRILEDSGFVVLTATSGNRALTVFDERSSDIDVVLTDLSMPDGDGRTLLRGIRDRGCTVPVLLMSGFVEGGAADVRDFAAFVPKPFSSESLTEALHKVMSDASE